MQEIREYRMSPDGEIIGTINVGDRIVRENSVKRYMQFQQPNKKPVIETDEPRSKWELNSFARVNAKELELLLPELTPNEKNMVITIIPYVSYSSCILAYGNKKHIDMDGLIKLTKLSRSVVYATVKSLGRKRILCRYILDNGYEFIVNPWLVSRGTEMNDSLRGIFHDYYIRSLKKSWKDLKGFQK